MEGRGRKGLMEGRERKVQPTGPQIAVTASPPGADLGYMTCPCHALFEAAEGADFFKNLP